MCGLDLQFKDLALYRLYILKSGDMESENGAAGSSSSSSQQMMPNAYDHFPGSPAAVSPCSPLQPWGISTGINYHQPLAAGASTSQIMSPPPPQQQHPSYAQYYQYQQQQHAFSAAAEPQAHTTHGAEFPGNMYQQYQLAIPPPAVVVPTAAANPEAAHQPPAMATRCAGQQDEAGPSGATRSPSPPPAAATEPGRVQVPDCVKMMEVAAPPTLEGIAPPVAKDESLDDADDYSELGMPDWNSNFDLMPLDDSYLQFTMEELLGVFPAFDGEPPAMEGDGNNSGGENYGQASDGGAKEDPPAALGCY